MSLLSVFSTLGQYTTTYDNSGGGGFAAITLLIYLVIVIAVVVANWKVYVKAGQPGWAVLVPIYNLVILMRIIKKPWWWILLLLIPIVNIVYIILISYELAKAFGYGVGMAILFFFSIGYLIVGFNSSKYQLQQTTATK